MSNHPYVAPYFSRNDSTHSEPIDTTAANAEASRLAHELGANEPHTTRWLSRRTLKKHSTTATDKAALSETNIMLDYTILTDAPVFSASSFPPSPPLATFDAHGQHMPYNEGPYTISREMNGRVVRQRWCKFVFVYRNNAPV
jgi:hypothetical protein